MAFSCRNTIDDFLAQCHSPGKILHQKCFQRRSRFNWDAKHEDPDFKAMPESFKESETQRHLIRQSSRKPEFRFSEQREHCFTKVKSSPMILSISCSTVVEHTPCNLVIMKSWVQIISCDGLYCWSFFVLFLAFPHKCCALKPSLQGICECMWCCNLYMQ